MLEQSPFSKTSQFPLKTSTNEWLTRIAFQIADDVARSDIECYCALRVESGAGEQLRGEEHADCWYDSTNIPDPDMQKTVEVAIIYLGARGLLKRHAQNNGWLRPLTIKKISDDRERYKHIASS